MTSRSLTSLLVWLSDHTVLVDRLGPKKKVVAQLSRIYEPANWSHYHIHEILAGPNSARARVEFHFRRFWARRDHVLPARAGRSSISSVSHASKMVLAMRRYQDHNFPT